MLIILLVCFIIFLFSLYYFSRDDFTMARKDISLEKIFNIAIITSIVALVFSRFVYVILSNNQELFKPLTFLDLPYYPGLSLIGGLIGFSAFTYLYSKYKGMPAGKIFDLFMMSIVTSLPFGYFFTFLVSIFNTSMFLNILFIVSIFIFALFAKIIFPSSIRGEIEDGSLGLMFLVLFSFFYFMAKLFTDIKNFSLLSSENIMIFILLFSSIIILINREVVDKFLNKK